MKKILNVITLGIPYIVNAIKIAKSVKEQADLNKDGKTTMAELAQVVKSGEIKITIKK